MDLMVKLDAVNMDVFQRILASYQAGVAQAQPAQPVPEVQPAAPVPMAVPPHVAAHQPSYPPRGNTPQTNYQNPTYPGYSNGYPPSNAPQAAPYSTGGSVLPPHLQNLPDDQKAMIAQVLSMTPDQINALPPTERNSIIQLVRPCGLFRQRNSILIYPFQRATLGFQ